MSGTSPKYISWIYDAYVRDFKKVTIWGDWQYRSAKDIIKSKIYSENFDLEELMAQTYDDHGIYYMLVYYEGKTASIYQNANRKFCIPSVPNQEFPDERDAIREWLQKLKSQRTIPNRFISWVYKYDRPKPGTSYEDIVSSIKNKNQKIFL